MQKKVKLYGNSPAIFYLGAKLLERSIEVECYAPLLGSSFGERRLRPLRLSRPVCDLIRNLYRTYQRPYFFIEKAPQLRTWGKLGTGAHAGSFDNDKNADRWISLEALRTDLRECFEKAGGIVFDVDGVSLPIEGNHHAIEILDLIPELLPREERRSFFPNLNTRRKFQIAEFTLANQREENMDCADLEFLKIENSMVFCEKLQDLRILTVFSASRYGRERVVRALLDPKSPVPTKWKAMILQSRGMRQQEYTTLRGPSGFYRPGVWALGNTVGSQSPMGNLQVGESILMASRLFEFLCSMTSRSSLLMEAEDWRLREAKAFERALNRGRILESIIFKDQWARGAKSQIVSLLPPRWRQKLASPV